MHCELASLWLLCCAVSEPLYLKYLQVLYLFFLPHPPLSLKLTYVHVILVQDEDMSADNPSRTAVTAHPVAERLDTLMAVLMAYVKDICHLNGSSVTQLLPQ